VRIDHQQPRAPEAGRLLADDLRLRHQAAGAQGLADPVVPRPRRQARRGDGRHHQREGDARPGGAVQDRHDARHRPDHAASFAQLTSGQVDAFATDDVLLYGLLAQHKLQADYVVTGEFLSYDPYGIMYRKGDTQLAKLVDDTFGSSPRTARSSAATSAGSCAGCRSRA
jgi:hypothetical protein